MARKSNGNGNTLAALAAAIEQHLDARERPIVTALTGLTDAVTRLNDGQARLVAGQAELARALGALREDVRAVRTDLRDLNRSTAANFEQLREDLRARGIPTRKPRFHRTAAE